MPRTPRVRAPALVGRGWLGAEAWSAEPALADLRGRVVVLDFLTGGCVNCRHVLDELRPLGRARPGVVVLGVHSPKFAHEASPAAVAAAVGRFGVDHPVLDDHDHTTWDAYAVRAWPTLVVVDPRGYVVGQYAGEGHVAEVAALVDELLAGAAEPDLEVDAAVDPPPPPAPDGLAYPAGLLPLPDGGLLVADAGHDRLVRLDARATGTPAVVPVGGLRPTRPEGLAALPAEVAAEVGYDVVVAEAGGDALLGLRLADGVLVRLVGDGSTAPAGRRPDRPSTPTGLAWWDDRVWVAASGTHQLQTYDPRSGVLAVAAGTGHEGLLDGPAAQAWFAQPTALAADGDRLWVVDAESSALRVVTRAGPDGHDVATVVGRGLFTYGFVDGPGPSALLQHPSGVAVLPDGRVAVADTYDGAVRSYDPGAGELSTLAVGLAEPVGLAVDLRADPPVLLVAEQAAHRVTRVGLDEVARATGERHGAGPEVRGVADGEVRLVVDLPLPPGQHLDDRDGPGSSLQVSATPPALLRAGAGRGSGLERRLVLDPAVGHGVLHVAARVVGCDDDGPGAACHLHHGDADVHVRTSPDGPRTLDVALR